MPNGFKRYAARHGRRSMFSEEMTWTPTKEVSDDDLSPQAGATGERPACTARSDKHELDRDEQSSSSSKIPEVGEQKKDGK
jgi:hypothetical protein